MHKLRLVVLSAIVTISTCAVADSPTSAPKQVDKPATTAKRSPDPEIAKLVARLNEPAVQHRVLEAARVAVLAQLKKDGISVTPEMLAQIATSNATEKRDAAETLAAGAVFIATVGIFSDVRLKHNIEHIGVSPSGINIYEFSYNGYSSRWQGVLAQELVRSHPNAVFLDQSGYLAVDYSKIDVPFGKP